MSRITRLVWCKYYGGILAQPKYNDIRYKCIKIVDFGRNGFSRE